MEVFEGIEQGSPEWKKLRAGLITASELKNLMRVNGEAAKTRRTYLLRLVGERVTGDPEDTYSNDDMDRGNTMEPEAIRYYRFMNPKAETKRVAFVRNATLIKGVTFGCSPDLLVGDRGLAQIKTMKASRLVSLMLKDEFPEEHKPQCYGEMWGSQRDWCDLVVYWPKMPPFIKRLYRDDRYIRTELSPAVNRFNAEVEELAAIVRRYGVAA